MLFIDPKHFNKGYGTIILQSLIQEDKIQYVDVNKDNQHALKFILKMVLKHIVNLKKTIKVEITRFYI